MNLKKLKVFSVETKGLSDFDLDCPQLRAMCTEFGARPNFTSPAEQMYYLYSKLIFSETPYDHLEKLLQQCPKLSTIGFDSVFFLECTLGKVNRGRISLPLLRAIRIDYSQFCTREFNDRLISCLVEYEESIKPERLQIFVFGQQIDLNRFVEIIQLVSSFESDDIYRPDPSPDLFDEHEILHCLHLSRPCFAINEVTQFDEELVVKYKNLRQLAVEPGSPRIDEALFKRMLSTWTKLEQIYLDIPNDKLNQHQLEMMPSYCPNLCVLALIKKPESFKFVVDFKNLRAFNVTFSLSREETMYLMRACPSLYCLRLFNESTQYRINLFTNRYLRYAKDYKSIFKLAIFNLSKDNPGKGHHCEFSSLEQLIDHFYKKDLFNKPWSVSVASNLKYQLKKKLHL